MSRPATRRRFLERRENGRRDAGLVMFLEPDQLTADTSVPVERALLGRRTRIALWVLRVAVVLVGAMVIYTFAAHLH